MDSNLYQVVDAIVKRLQKAENTIKNWFFHSPELRTKGTIYTKCNADGSGGVKIPEVHGISQGGPIVVTSTSMKYMNNAVTIPPHSVFTVSFLAVYSYSRPVQVLISNSSTAATDIASSNVGQHTAEVTYSGVTDNEPLTLYAWAAYSSAANNYVHIRGFYITLD